MTSGPWGVGAGVGVAVEGSVLEEAGVGEVTDLQGRTAW
jgi:hypothetical protein